MGQIFTEDDEQRLRELAIGIARQIEEPLAVIDRLGFTSDDYDELSQTRMFKTMLAQAINEWEGAANTHKRIKQKAAVNVEEALPHFYRAMTDPKEPLSSKVKALEIVSRIGGLGNPELVAPGAGQFFKLEINLGAGVTPISLGVDNMTIEHDAQEAMASYSKSDYSQSKLFDTIPLEDL
jgi:hypothetical protein